MPFEFPWGAVMAAGWPWRNVHNMARANPKGDEHKRNVNGDFSGGRLRPIHNQLGDYVGVQCSSLPKIGIAILCWQYTVDMQAASTGYDFSLDGWVAKVFLRDLFLMVAIAGVWDYLLYFSPLKQRLAPYKFNSAYPQTSQLARDRIAALQGDWVACARGLGCVWRS